MPYPVKTYNRYQRQVNHEQAVNRPKRSRIQQSLTDNPSYEYLIQDELFVEDLTGHIRGTWRGHDE